MRSTKQLKEDIINLCRIIPPDSVGVEIGCFGGESSVMFAKSGKFKKLYCVDPWTEGYYRKHNMKEIESMFDISTKDFPIIKKMKMKGNQFFHENEDPNINFVYIDGDHSYEAVHNDIRLWMTYFEMMPKKGTRILAGHDYKHKSSPGVERAVKELLGYPDIRFAGYSWAKIIKGNENY